MKASKFIWIFFVLLIFLTACSSKNLSQSNDINTVKKTPTETKLTPSAVPPTPEEIVKLKNGYQITSAMKLVIDQRCAANGAKGGDTGSGYGCVAA